MKYIHTQTVDEIFESLLGSIKPTERSRKARPFAVRCGAILRRPPRHPYFADLLDLGAWALPSIVDHVSFRQDPKVLRLVFPERHLNIPEQQFLLTLLGGHPEASRIERVDILTASPMLTGDVPEDSLVTVGFPDDASMPGPWFLSRGNVLHAGPIAG